MANIDRVLQNRFHLLYKKSVEKLGKDYLEAWADALHEYNDVIENSLDRSCYDWFVSNTVLRQLSKEEREEILGRDWESIKFQLSDLCGGADAMYREVMVPVGTDADLDDTDALVRDIVIPEGSNPIAILDCEDGSSVEVSLDEILAQVRDSTFMYGSLG
ncbi:hypothetical protein [Sulfitobacter sp. R18_1]|uniref:hypothetical protein n=1 Tax=Sulfitobacter sp. R18_1 TaxID=2821104 RepID=UPI001ADCABFC|nr:hypothetical protein [Sulfitobacter sp. R18_1]MBO9427916.1 hypothetical protein [Sulfitobacter sp. R18_1]